MEVEVGGQTEEEPLGSMRIRRSDLSGALQTVFGQNAALQLADLGGHSDA